MKPTTPGARIEAVLIGFDGPAAQKLLLLGVAVHDGEGGSWPSVSTLSTYAGIAERNVRAGLAKLQAAGWIEVHRNEGGTRNTRADRRTNLYVVDYDRLTARGDATIPPSPPTGGSLDPSRGDPDVRHGGIPGSGERDLEQDREQDVKTTLDVVELDATTSAAFDAFWSAYPRKVGKRTARTAFDRAAKRAPSLSTIVRGAVVYRDDPNRTDEFTAHPTTWLNRDGWDDAPLPARTHGRPAMTVGRQAVAQVRERLRQHDPQPALPTGGTP